MGFKGASIVGKAKAKDRLKKVWNYESKAVLWGKVFLDVAMLCVLEGKWEMAFQNKG